MVSARPPALFLCQVGGGCGRWSSDFLTPFAPVVLTAVAWAFTSQLTPLPAECGQCQPKPPKRISPWSR